MKRLLVMIAALPSFSPADAQRVGTYEDAQTCSYQSIRLDELMQSVRHWEDKANEAVENANYYAAQGDRHFMDVYVQQFDHYKNEYDYVMRDHNAIASEYNSNCVGVQFDEKDIIATCDGIWDRNAWCGLFRK